MLRVSELSVILNKKFFKFPTKNGLFWQNCYKKTKKKKKKKKKTAEGGRRTFPCRSYKKSGQEKLTPT